MKINMIAEVCQQLRASGSIQEICRNGLLLIKKHISPERFSILLNEDVHDTNGSFCGFSSIAHPIQSREDLLRITNGTLIGEKKTAFIAENMEIVDINNVFLVRADQLFVPLVTCTGKELGWLIADNRIEEKPWDAVAIDTFQLIAWFIANTLLIQKTMAKQQSMADNKAMKGGIEYTEQGAAFINAMFDHLEERFYFKDRQSKLLGANKAWLQSKKVKSIDELLGKTDLDLFPEPLGRQLFEAEQQLMATGTTTRVREKHSHPDGTIQYIDAIKCPMRDKNQEIIGLAGISRDVTQQVENEFLLMAARTKAESAATAKSAFLADMSHEIRTPLNAVLGMTSLLSATPMNDEQHELVHVIHTSGEALLALINDVLDFSKIEAGALQQEMKPFKIRHCIANSLEIISTKAFEKSLDLVCCITGDVPESCVGDAPHLRQILLNLMSNATKFTDHGTIALHIAGTPLSRQEYRLDFSVTDTGIGMTQEVLGRIFKPFEQADASTKRIHGGTGLGLSISHRLVEMMGGILQVKSSVGVGSEFFFSITLHVPAGETPNPLRNQQNTLKGKRALIVTGNPTSLTIWERQLADWGITPIPFNNVSSVISCLNTLNPIDFAILDTMTPDINAALLTAELRKRPEFKNLPVVNLCEPRCTLLPSDPVIDAHLNKPVMPERLQEKLRLFLEKAEKPVVKIAPKIESTIIASNPLRILLAEDNPVNQKVAVKMLARLGYEVDVVENGLEAVNADQNKIYDLVFMDIQMPVMSGLEATKAILNRYPDGNGPKIVAMTAHALQECRQEGIDCGMTGYIVKPIRLEVLTEILSGIPRRSD